MHIAARFFAYVLVGLSVGSYFLFPKYNQYNNFPNLASLQTLQRSVEELKKNNPKAISVWRSFQSMLMEEYATLQFEQVSQNELNQIFDSIRDLAIPILKSVMTQSSKHLNELSSYERYLLSQMLQQSLKHLEEGSIAFKFLVQFSKKLETYEMTPYEYFRGLAKEKSLKGQVKVMSWNTCLLPGRLSEFVGGQAPWYERIETICQIIGAQKADVVCLQEVHAEPAALALYEGLKKDYAHFYINMGPKTMAADVSDVGLNSGLFIASKYPLEHLYFEGFKNQKGRSQVNKGFFFAEFKGVGMGLITCHLEPGETDAVKNIRKDQLERVIRYFQDSPLKVKILAGDLNIPWGAGEPAEGLLQTYFYDPYNKNRQDVSRYSRTFSDLFLKKEGTGSNEILDYFLIFQEPGFEKYAVITERVEGFDEVLLKEEASDHHGLISSVIFPQELEESR